VRALGPALFVRVGLLIIAVGIGLMIGVARFDFPIATAILAWAVGGLGMGLAYSPISLVTLAQATAGAEGEASASLTLSDTLGIALGTGMTGAIVAAGAAIGSTRGDALAVAFVVCGAVAILTSIAAVRLPSLVTDHDHAPGVTSGLTPEPPP
jgi:hypothetical protein